MLLKEDKQLYRGIFWIPDVDNVCPSQLYFTILCDSNGIINEQSFTISPQMYSTGSDNYNHKKLYED